MKLINRKSPWIVFIFSILICLSFSGLYPIYILDEARNSEAAREMLASKDFIVPYFNGQLRTDKPPLHYFFMILGYKVFGINAFGARFFSGLFGALTILITFLSVRKYSDNKEAWIVTLILLSSLFFVQEFHLAVPDPYLIFFISASLFSFFHFYKSKSKKWLWFAYAAIGFGILTKGPIALVLPGLIIPAFLIFSNNFSFKTIFQFRPFIGLAIVLVIATPWYYLVHGATDGEWTKGFLFDHNISRFSSEKEGHGGLFFITPLFVILGMLPFSVFIIQGFDNAWKLRSQNNFLLFSFTTTAVTILFFSIASTKLPNYPMPCYPFIGVLIGNYLYRLSKKKSKSKSTTISLAALILISSVIPIAGFIALTLENQFFEVRFISLLLVITTIGTIVAFYFYGKADLKKTFLSIAGSWTLTGLCLFGIIYPTLTAKSPVSMALKIVNSESKIIVYQRIDSAFPINFNRVFEVTDKFIELESFLCHNPDGFILTNTRDKSAIKEFEKYTLILEQKALFENHITRIYKK
ncbi:ArnT family glycosyltransferase [Croceitalea rosinachiae]|uniref:Glycosyltransferase family 39 protein n=1 Tax=Croceitalea rosinachiae TaxID=3075596 RepID=A0ABU3AEH5_9FLAO|nr:glycosyltransferase family 39 protein [Croceitalea sp. F388]MDT0608590.1 glycosyltransferase family 39 protein [Croceitalea sp. F388]